MSAGWRNISFGGSQSGGAAPPRGTVQRVNWERRQGVKRDERAARRAAFHAAHPNSKYPINHSASFVTLEHLRGQARTEGVKFSGLTKSALAARLGKIANISQVSKPKRKMNYSAFGERGKYDWIPEAV